MIHRFNRRYRRYALPALHSRPRRQPPAGRPTTRPRDPRPLPGRPGRLHGRAAAACHRPQRPLLHPHRGQHAHAGTGREPAAGQADRRAPQPAAGSAQLPRGDAVRQVVANAPSPRITEETVKTIHFPRHQVPPRRLQPRAVPFVQNFVINSATQRPLFRPPPPDRVQPAHGGVRAVASTRRARDCRPTTAPRSLTSTSWPSIRSTTATGARRGSSNRSSSTSRATSRRSSSHWRRTSGATRRATTARSPHLSAQPTTPRTAT